MVAIATMPKSPCFSMAAFLAGFGSDVGFNQRKSLPTTLTRTLSYFGSSRATELGSSEKTNQVVMIRFPEASEDLSFARDVRLMSHPSKSFLKVVFVLFCLSFLLIRDFDGCGTIVWSHYPRRKLQLKVKSLSR